MTFFTLTFWSFPWRRTGFPKWVPLFPKDDLHHATWRCSPCRIHNLIIPERPLTHSGQKQDIPQFSSQHHRGSVNDPIFINDPYYISGWKLRYFKYSGWFWNICFVVGSKGGYKLAVCNDIITYPTRIDQWNTKIQIICLYSFLSKKSSLSFEKIKAR